MFNKGILKGSKISIPIGGHVSPSSIVGDRLEWKNLQKKDIKNRISDEMNKIIPHFIPINTWLVWNPWNVLSRTTSRHQVNIVNRMMISPIFISIKFLKCKYLIDPVSKVNTPIALVMGHGL